MDKADTTTMLLNPEGANMMAARMPQVMLERLSNCSDLMRTPAGCMLLKVMVPAYEDAPLKDLIAIGNILADAIAEELQRRKGTFH